MPSCAGGVGRVPLPKHRRQLVIRHANLPLPLELPLLGRYIARRLVRRPRLVGSGSHRAVCFLHSILHLLSKRQGQKSQERPAKRVRRAYKVRREKAGSRVRRGDCRAGALALEATSPAA